MSMIRVTAEVIVDFKHGENMDEVREIVEGAVNEMLAELESKHGVFVLIQKLLTHNLDEPR